MHVSHAETWQAGGMKPIAPPAVGDRRLHIQQKLTFVQNQYRVLHDVNGEPGGLMAYAKQKRFTFREKFTLYSDEAMHLPLLEIEADRGFDIRSVLVVTDVATGHVVGRIRKKGAVSLLVSTWELEQPGMPLVEVRERNILVAILRRFVGLLPYANSVPIPWVFHFDGVAADGTKVLSHTRRWGFRDRYVMDLHVEALDIRLAVALGVALDAMQKR